MSGRYQYQNSIRQRGYILATLGIMSVAITASVGLAVDIGTAYIVRNESQTYCDSAALSAALELDGSDAGIAAARTRALAVPNRWGFSNSGFSGVVVEFAESQAGPWSATPASAAGIRFARVTAGADVPMVFLPLVTNDRSALVRARAIAGQLEKFSFSNGVFPYSPFAHDPSNADGNWGFEPGQIYALRWPNNMNKHSKLCPGDEANPDVVQMKIDSGEAVQGYIDSNSAADIREAILTDEMHGGRIYEIGQPLFMANGNKQAEERAMQDRVEQDTDTTSKTYADYIAEGGDDSGRRLVIVPINSGPSDNFRIVGFASFFLLVPSAYQTSPSDSFCAEYVGPAILGGTNQGGGEAGAYAVRLVE